MGRVILADDDDLIGEIVTDTFISAGHGIGWLKNGKDALEAMKFRAPDLAILDLHMPELNGMDTLRQMRSNSDLAMIPVMMLTVVEGDGAQRIAFYDGVDDYMTKPFDPEELLVRAEALMKNRIKRVMPFGSKAR